MYQRHTKEQLLEFTERWRNAEVVRLMAIGTPITNGTGHLSTSRDVRRTLRRNLPIYILGKGKGGFNAGDCPVIDVGGITGDTMTRRKGVQRDSARARGTLGAISKTAGLAGLHALPWSVVALSGPVRGPRWIPALPPFDCLLLRAFSFAPFPAPLIGLAAPLPLRFRLAFGCF